MTQEILAAAAAYAARGWVPIRLYGLKDGRCTCAKGGLPSHVGQAGKHPTDPAWQTTQVGDAAGLTFTGMHEVGNLGVLTGRPSGFFVLDIDPDNGGGESLQKMMADHGPLPPTMMQRTGSGGWHALYAMPEDFEPTNRRGGIADYPGIDVRGTGGQIVVAPSVSGKGPYAWRPGDLDGTPAPAPEWLLELLRPAPHAESAPRPSASGASDSPYFAAAVAGEVARLHAMWEAATPDGVGYRGAPWNETVFSVACNLLELANSGVEVDVLETLLSRAPQDDGFGEDEIRQCFVSAQTTVGDRGRPAPPLTIEQEIASWMADAPAPAPVAFDPPVGVEPSASTPARPLNDVGNGRRLADHLAGRLLWDGGWCDADGVALTFGQVRHLAGEAMKLAGDLEQTTDRPALQEWLAGQGAARRMTAALRRAQDLLSVEAEVAPEPLESQEGAPVGWESASAVVKGRGERMALLVEGAPVQTRHERGFVTS